MICVLLAWALFATHRFSKPSFLDICLWAILLKKQHPCLIMVPLIRSASVSDMPAVLDLMCELGRPHTCDGCKNHANDGDHACPFDEIIRQYITDEDKKLLVAESDNTVVGLASVIFLVRCNQIRLEMYIPELIVSSRYRGLGIGRLLVEYCITLARKHECYRIRLESGNWREKSHMFYKRMGFVNSSQSFELPILYSHSAD